VVTGSDSGIGKAIAVALAGGVDITYHEGAAQTADQVRVAGARCAVRQLDLTDLPAAAGVIDELAEELGGVDVLVNCAGTGSSQKVVEMPFDTWREVISVDLDGAFLCCQRAAKRMIAAGRDARPAGGSSCWGRTTRSCAVRRRCAPDTAPVPLQHEQCETRGSSKVGSTSPTVRSPTTTSGPANPSASASNVEPAVLPTPRPAEPTS
jgi:NAD(P)-dependent dehydrogenase (short-subunit alcohol dehydrogenase family)